MDGMFAIEKGRDGIRAGGYNDPSPCRHPDRCRRSVSRAGRRSRQARSDQETGHGRRHDNGVSCPKNSEPRKAVKAGVKFDAEDVHDQMTATEKTKTTNETTRK